MYFDGITLVVFLDFLHVFQILMIDEVAPYKIVMNKTINTIEYPVTVKVLDEMKFRAKRP